MLSAGVGANGHNDDPSAVDPAKAETLDDLLGELDVCDADWRIGNYQVLEEIGRGGMGVIYRARQRHSRRIVALKRILSYHADSQETLARFRREAQAAASLDHPNILPIRSKRVRRRAAVFQHEVCRWGQFAGCGPGIAW